jgi:hypothetical protein
MWPGVYIIWHITEPGMAVQKNISPRLPIFPKDVELITRRKHRTACTMLQQIRKVLGKAKHQFVTITEFCQYFGLKEELVKEFLVP